MSQETSLSSEPKVVWHDHSVDRLSREKLNGHRGRVIWFTGLSGSGKSTIANLVDQQLHALGYRTFLLDGDNIRHGLCAGPQILQKNHTDEFAKRFGLGFSPEDREENIRRIGAVAELFASAGVIALTAFVSPYRRDRDSVRKWVNEHGREGDFVEVFVDTPIEICQQRDPKGLYKLAMEGKIPHFTGVSDPYESPESPELHLIGHPSPPDKLAEQVVKYLQETDATKLAIG